MTGNGLSPVERRTAYRLALELARTMEDAGVMTKQPLRRAALRQLAYLIGDEGLLAPEPEPSVNLEAER